MRSIEALGAGLKLATNNEIVRKYSFYDPDRIYVIDHESRTFSEFLSSKCSDFPHSELDPLYLPNWIDSLLDPELERWKFLYDVQG